MVWKAVKKEVQKLIDNVLETIIVNPMKVVLKALGFYKFIGWIEKGVKFVMDILNFFLDMVGIIADLLNFGVKFIEVLIEIAKKMGYYASRPFEFITMLLNLGFTLATFTTAFVYHKFTFPNNLKIAEFFIYVLFLIPITIVFVVLIAIWAVWKLFIEFIILHNIDKSSKGYVSSFIYRYFVGCENAPDDWYMLSGAHHGNMSAKNVFAYNPCPTGSNFRGNKFALFCEKNKRYELQVCPEANLYRAYLDLKPIGKVSNSKMITDREFIKLSSVKKKLHIENYEETITKNINKCADFNASKENLLKSICIKQNVEGVQKNPLINKLCHDVYCSKTREAFCHKLVPGQLTSISDLSNTGKLTLIVNVLIAITSITLIVGRKHFFVTVDGA